MSRKTDAVVASTIGIDIRQDTLHLIGLDRKARSFCEKRLPAAGLGPACKHPAMPDRDRGWYCDTLCCAAPVFGATASSAMSTRSRHAAA
jgi:hypothetical protein